MDQRLIEQVMQLEASRYFAEKQLQEMMLTFVAYKCTESMRFGELVTTHYRMFGGQSDDIYTAAAAVEFLILALDIFDDLQDQDNDRVPWSRVESAQAMNIALGFLALSTNSLAGTSFPAESKAKAIELIHIQLAKSVTGQFIDVRNQVQEEDEFLEMIRAKSGALAACACLVGTVLASGQLNDTVAAYGEMLGMAAQILNDIEGVRRWDTKNDLIHRKRTLPILFLLDLQGDVIDLVRDYYGGKASREQLLLEKHTIMDLIDSSGCIAYAKIHLKLLKDRYMELIGKLKVDADYMRMLEKFI